METITTPHPDPRILTVEEQRRMKLIELLEAQAEGHGMPNFQWDFSELHADGGCGTSGCALGLAAVHPAFPGFTTEELFGDFYDKNGDYVEYHAERTYFGMTEQEVLDIFYGHAYRLPYRAVTPRMVAAKLREITPRV